MAIRVKLYGDLREKIAHVNKRGGFPVTLDLKTEGFKTVFDVLKKFDITDEEISHIFVNNKYSGIKHQVNDGDRIGLFPKRMGIIFVEIINN